MGHVEEMARLVCREAGKGVNHRQCVICEGGPCSMWKDFRDEARAYVRLAKKWAGEEPAPDGELDGETCKTCLL